MISGAHAIVYSRKPEEDRAFFRDVIGLPYVDVNDGWLIFGLPPAEVAVHPAEKNDVHELYLMCDDVEAFIAAAGKRGVRCEPVMDRGWGLLTQVRLPGGGKLGVYQPRHARPRPFTGRRPAARGRVSATRARKPASSAPSAAASPRPRGGARRARTTR